MVEMEDTVLAGIVIYSVDVYCFWKRRSKLPSLAHTLVSLLGDDILCEDCDEFKSASL